MDTTVVSGVRLDRRGTGGEGITQIAVGQTSGERAGCAKRPSTVIPGHPETPYQLAELLVAHQMITARQLELAVEHHRKTGVRLGDALLQLHVLSEEELLPLLEWLFLAEQHRTATMPSVLGGPGALQRVSAAVRRTMARWRGGWDRELATMPPKLPSKARP